MMIQRQKESRGKDARGDEDDDERVKKRRGKGVREKEKRVEGMIVRRG